MAEERSDRFRLILHVGAGKTGTTSIQQYLARVSLRLAQEGVAYWGYMLDRAPFRQFPWQDQFQTELFLRMDRATAADQLTLVLEQSIKVAQSAGIHTAIWSNEAIFDRAQNVLAALDRLDRARVDIVVIAYVRQHDAWAASAYLQWGLKHKSYSGELVPFRRYVEMRPVRFMNGCEMWRKGAEASFLLRNYDAAGDVIADFSAVLGLPLFDSRERANKSPSLEETFFRALFNSRAEGEVLPTEFNQNMAPTGIDFALDPQRWLSGLLPDDADIAEVMHATQSDRRSLNELLAEAGQPLLTDRGMSVQGAFLDHSKLIGVLAQLAITHSQKIRALEKQLAELLERSGRST
jgi:hypothetical protein